MSVFAGGETYRTPMVLSCQYFDTKDCGWTPLRVVADYEFEFNFRGGRSMQIDGDIFDVPRGACIFRRPGQHVCSKGSLCCYGIKLDFSWRPSLPGENRYQSSVIQVPYPSAFWEIIPTMFIPTHQEDLRRIYSRLIGISAPDINEDPATPWLLAELIHLLVVDSLCERTTNSSHPSPNSMEPVCQYIQLHYQRELTLDDLASTVHLNKNHFARKFKQQIGISPIEYLISVRLKNARDLLLTSSNSVKNISFDCGFRNQSYFNYAFRKQFGETPGEYRKRYRGSEQP